MSNFEIQIAARARTQGMGSGSGSGPGSGGGGGGGGGGRVGAALAMGRKYYAPQRMALQQQQVGEQDASVTNLGTSENLLIARRVQRKVSEIWTSEEVLKAATTMEYSPFAGLPSVRETFADFMNEFVLSAGPGDEPLAADNMILCSGATAALEAVITLLCACGDCVLVPAPFYNGFLMDIALRSGVQVVRLESRSVAARGWAAAAAELPPEQLARARAIVVSHPNNPLGQALSPSEMREMLLFAQQHQLHIISDEVYANCRHGESAARHLSFHSFASSLGSADSLGAHCQTHLHLLYSLSKDFGLASWRAAAIASHNAELLEALQYTGRFHSVPLGIQAAVAQLLSRANWAWIRATFSESQALLAQALAICSAALPAQASIVGAPAFGLFCVVDLSYYVDRVKAHEGSVSAAQLSLLQHLVAHSAPLLAPGEAFGCGARGHFRLCFAAVAALPELRREMDKLRGALEELE